MKITILGNGNMAKAIIKGLESRYEIEVVGRDIKKLQKLKKELPNITISTYNTAYSIENKNIILCTKPNSINDLSKILNGEANNFFSVLAGVKIDILKKSFKSKNYVRVMPNLGAKYLKSTTSLVGDDISLASEIFKYLGDVIILNTEKELDIATAIAGSGPAFLAIVAEAIEDAGVINGLKREDSSILVNSLFNSFATLAQNYYKPKIKDEVTSPAGTTAAGIVALEENGVRNAFIKSITNAYKRAQELAK